HVAHEPLDRVRIAVGRLVALAVTTVVEHDDGVIPSERGNVIGEVFLCAPEPVHQEQARTASRDLDGERDAVVGDNTHEGMFTHGAPSAPPRITTMTEEAPSPSRAAQAGRRGASWKLVVRIVVSAGLLVVLVVK